MKGVPQVVNTLNGLLAGELMAADQYLAHGEIYSDLGLVRLAEHTLHESDHEREHARAIIQRILFLATCLSSKLRIPRWITPIFWRNKSGLLNWLVSKIICRVNSGQSQRFSDERPKGNYYHSQQHIKKRADRDKSVFPPCKDV